MLSTLDAMDTLDRLTTDIPEREIIQQGVDLAQSVTGSRIAYLHFLNEDQNTLELGVWSKGTVGYCTAVYARHYPIEAAGIWADSARFRTHCIHNDYEAETNKRGLPDGHSPLIRHLGMPVIDDGLVRMLVGVGNKAVAYDDADVALLSLVARRIWSVARQRRTLERYIDLEQRFRHIQAIASVCALEYDLDEDALHFDGMYASIFRTVHATETPSNLHEFLSVVAPVDHDRVRAAFADASVGRQMIRIECHRQTGDRFPAELKIEFRPREVGQGAIGIGVLQDISELMMVDELRRRADTDPLTGLPNRNRLQAFFASGMQRRGPRDGIAFHYIDLDGFKPVNDTYGHTVGDEVLRVIAQRLQQVVRRDDLVVRMGGDEFAIVQTGIEGASSADVLAQKVVAVVASPITAVGRQVVVGASIGVAVSISCATSLKDISDAADRALYQAKSAGGRRHVLSEIDAN
jgi:diguanylate cyclase (GGDEF)-like protein